jgi:hypothetical protein
MDMGLTCLLDPLHGLDELNSLVQVAEDQVEETDFFKNDMSFARNSLWLFSSSMDEDSSVSGFALPSKVLREREPKKRRLVLDLEKLPMVQFYLQEPRLMLSAPNLQTCLLKGSFEGFWEWMAARNLVRNEDRESWRMKIKKADDYEQELGNDFDRPTEDENGILLDLKKAFIDAADAVEQEELKSMTSSPNNSSCSSGPSTGEKRGSFSFRNEETRQDGKRRKHSDSASS